jgi:hypothetical protein
MFGRIAGPCFGGSVEPLYYIAAQLDRRNAVEQLHVLGSRVKGH